MRTMKKIISMLLVFSILTVALCSCDIIGKNPEKLIEEAEMALKEKAYTVEMAIQYTSEDEKMSEAISAFTNPSIVIESDGESFRITMSFDKDGRKNGVKYTYTDGILYTELNKLGEITNTKEKISEADRKELAESLGQAAGISVEDFQSVDAKSFNGVSVITCTEIKDEPLCVLVDSLSEQLGGEVFVAIKDVNLSIQLTDGLYDKTLLTCDYVLSLDDEVYTVTMTYAARFSYGEVEEITAPVF